MPSVELFKESYEQALSQGETVCGIVLINPHNPTGAIYPRDKVLEVCFHWNILNIYCIILQAYIYSIVFLLQENLSIPCIIPFPRYVAQYRLQNLSEPCTSLNCEYFVSPEKHGIKRY